MSKGDKLKVLFVCTGNIFRSLSAEYCMKDYLKRNNIKNITVHSAGTVANKEHAHPAIITTLKSHGIIIKNHVQTKLTKEIAHTKFAEKSEARFIAVIIYKVKQSL